MSQQKQQQKLEALIRDLERDLTEGKSQVAALEETHQRLQESERICQELADENRRLGKEITGWQERFAKSEENQRQASMLRQQLEALQAEHARVLERNRQMQEKLTASSQPGKVSSPVEGDSAGATSLQSKTPTVAALTLNSTGPYKAGGNLLDSSDSAPRAHATKWAKASQIAHRLIVRRWQVCAVFAGIIIFVIVGAVTIKKILTTEVPSSRGPVVSIPEATGVEPEPEPVSKAPVKTAARVKGVFQTVRSTQVFSGPSEDSELVANIGKGMKVNVVNSKDGWLEIRSKHGRPPGFVRQEATVRIGSN
jgi:hypothetical protein